MSQSSPAPLCRWRGVEGVGERGRDSLRVEVLGVGNVFSDMIYVLKGGVEDSEFPPAGLADELTAMKRTAYQPELGTWIGFTMTLSSSGGLTIDYNFDVKPDFDFDPSFRDYQLELERFPRAGGSVPEWWRERIAQGDG